ncbi:transforming growth factor beta activator LRRC32 [Gadus morhua]|uniref:transforming growth factor beta activator LRRC32 n=1 Tax=Gadus morhua TaxID=8049 RepID=UPI0011B7C605|nr:transforming growth factor beta activator LRRC32-like [Gadus morhua]
MLRHIFFQFLLLWFFGQAVHGISLLYHDEKWQPWNRQARHTTPLKMDMKLRRLDLSKSFIRQLHTLGLPHLQQLDLSYNQLDLIAEEAFINLAQLEALNLSKNALYNNVGRNGRALRSIGGLRRLDISLNNLNDEAVELYLQNKFSLIHLDLTGNGITALTHNTFKECQGLKTIIAANNLIRDIEPGTFEPLMRLETLDLSQNNLAHICDFQLHQVNYLNLSQNSIEFFMTRQDEELFRLEILDLSDNKLFYFPIVPKFIHLRYLYLQNNMIGALNSEATMISEARSVYKEIVIGKANTKYHEIFSNWRIMPLIYIDLSSNHFRSVPFETLSLLTSLETLNFSRNCLQNIELNITKPGQLGYNYRRLFPSLRHLDLQKNSLRYITPLFFKALPKLETLNLQANSVKPCPPGNGLGRNKSDQHALGRHNMSCVAFRQIKTLKHLNLEDNGIQVLYANTFEKTSLAHLNLAGNRHMVLEEGTLEGVQGSLQSLSLSATNVSSRDLSLPCMPALSQLNLSNNHLDSIPVSLSCSPLRVLDLSNNALVSLNPSLIRAMSSHLSALYIRGNRFDCCNASWVTVLNESRVNLPDLSEAKCAVQGESVFLAAYIESPSGYCLFQTTVPVTVGQRLIVFIFVMTIVSMLFVFTRLWWT